MSIKIGVNAWIWTSPFTTSDPASLALLDSLTDADSVAVWARSQAVLNQWAAAMTGYNRLLQMRRRPEELAEAARVCASAGDRARARELITRALRRLEEPAGA